MDELSGDIPRSLDTKLQVTFPDDISKTIRVKELVAAWSLLVDNVWLIPVFLAVWVDGFSSTSADPSLVMIKY